MYSGSPSLGFGAFGGLVRMLSLGMSGGVPGTGITDGSSANGGPTGSPMFIDPIVSETTSRRDPSVRHEGSVRDGHDLLEHFLHHQSVVTYLSLRRGMSPQLEERHQASCVA